MKRHKGITAPAVKVPSWVTFAAQCFPFKILKKELLKNFGKKSQSPKKVENGKDCEE